MGTAKDDPDNENCYRAIPVNEGAHDLRYPEENADCGKDMNGDDRRGTESAGC